MSASSSPNHLVAADQRTPTPPTPHLSSGAVPFGPPVTALRSTAQPAGTDGTPLANRRILRSAAAPALRVGGMTPLTSIDFPGRLAAVLYCQGCPWRCGYCHNPELLDATTPAAMDWPQVLAFLDQRRGLLDGVVFSGGEPTLQAALPAALAAVRAMGFETALHTGGMYPERLSALLPLLHWVGLDIKGPLHRYDAITRTPGSGVKAFESLRRLRASGVAYECRTTWHAGLFGVEELFALVDDLAAQGVTQWALQECRAPGAAAWGLTPEQVAQLGAPFMGFALRRG